MVWLLILVLATGQMVEKPVRTATECEVQATLIKKVWNEEKTQILRHLCKPDKRAA